MKRIYLLLVLLSFVNTSFAQEPNTVKIGSANVTVKALGGLKADSAFQFPMVDITKLYTKGMSSTGQGMVNAADSLLYYMKNTVVVKVMTQFDSNKVDGYATISYVINTINTLINDSSLSVSYLGFGLKKEDTVLLVDSLLIPTVLKLYKVADSVAYVTVPYTGAIANLNMGVHSVTAQKVLTDTVIATSSGGVLIAGTGGLGVLVGSGGGADVTLDGYPTIVPGDSVLSTNSSGDVVLYNLKDKLAEYITASTMTQVVSTTNFTTSYAINSTDARPVFITITAQVGALLYSEPTGTWTDGQLLVIKDKATGSDQTRSWNAKFRETVTTALPTVISSTYWTTSQFIYNATDDTYDYTGPSVQN